MMATSKVGGALAFEVTGDYPVRRRRISTARGSDGGHVADAQTPADIISRDCNASAPSLAALHARRLNGLMRVPELDFDVLHGNIC